MKNLIPALICLFLAIPCQGTIIYVDANGSADFETIQAAIDDSNAGDEIIVAEGTYVENINLNGKNITLRSTDPNDSNVVATTIIDGNDIGTVVTFYSGEDANCVLSGFTIINGNGDLGLTGMGGGIDCYKSSPTITNCIISGNFAGIGGGMLNHDSNSTLTNCTFSDNSATGGWGGSGGGMCNVDSNSTLTNCTFSDNSAGGEYGAGGGMYNTEYSSLTMANCTFSGNSAVLVGGGMCNSESSPTLTNCTFSGNSAAGVEMGAGGGMFNGGWMINGGSEPNLMNCTFSGNFAVVGGGMYNNYSSPTLTNCTFNGNSANSLGGGMCNLDSNSTLTNCILWSNTAEMNGDQIAIQTTVYPSTATISYSDVQGGLGAVYIAPNCSVIWGLGNIDADPCFVEPGQWVDVNDPNIIVEPNDPNAFWIDGDYHLKSFGWRWDSVRQRWDYDDVTSRCIDAGNPGSPLRDELPSIPGYPDNPYGENIRINMGAYGGTAEASMPPYDWALLSDLTNDGTVDFVDFAHAADMFASQGGELPGDFDRDGDVDLADLDWLTYDWLLQTIWYEP